MSKWDINWEYTYKKMPKEVRNFLKELLGEKEFKKLMRQIHKREWIMMIGPVCSGKSTVRDILLALGYPFIVDDDGLGMVIHTSRKLTDLKPIDDILEELGIGSKH